MQRADPVYKRRLRILIDRALNSRARGEAGLIDVRGQYTYANWPSGEPVLPNVMASARGSIRSKRHIGCASRARATFDGRFLARDSRPGS